MFFLPPSSPFISLCLLLCITMVVYCFFFGFFIIIFSTELLALCDRCLGLGWVWRAGLVAGLRVGQAFGMFLLPGFGVGSSSPWVPGHPTSMWDQGVTLALARSPRRVSKVSGERKSSITRPFGEYDFNCQEII